MNISTPYSLPREAVQVTIAGQPADITYAGEAPFAPTGVWQINAKIPAAASPGNAPVTVSIATIADGQQITVAVK
jgi:uncharacterized protein (TIGR03437 family)